MNKRKVIMLWLALLLIVVVVVGSTLKFSLGRFVISAFPKEYGSLREVLTFYQNELARQGKHVEIRVLNESDYDEVRDLRGMQGNAYLYLFALEKQFGVNIEFGIWRTITVSRPDPLSPR